MLFGHKCLYPLSAGWLIVRILRETSLALSRWIKTLNNLLITYFFLNCPRFSQTGAFSFRLTGMVQFPIIGHIIL